MSKYGLFAVTVLLLSIICISCSTNKNTITNDASSFTGKWYSSRLRGLIDIKSNGTWEIRTANGKICQSGKWYLRNDQFVWIYNNDPTGKEDINKIIKSSSETFILKEMDNSITRFERRK